MPLDSRVGVIGIGLMGSAIVERLLDHGYQPAIWNRSREKAEPYLHRGAVWSDNPLLDCRRVIVSLYSSDVVAEVLGGWLEQIQSGTVVIDTTTGDPQHSQRWSALLRQVGAEYLDAPISGSSQQTRQGEATVLVSGDQTTYEACCDLWPVMGGKTFYCGASGNAAQLKLVSNLVLGLNRAALAEGLAFAEALQLDAAVTLAVLRGSPAYSRQMDTKGQKMIDREYAVQARLAQHRKDVQLMLEGAGRVGLNLPLTKTHLQVLLQAEEMELGESDNSAIVEVWRRGKA